MAVALISDIHANIEALEAVFAHIDAQPEIEEVYCLGDVVGYGPDPEPCIDLLRRRCRLTLMGNHDFALLNAAVGFNRIAAGAITCTRTRMEPGVFSLPEKQDRWDWLRELPERARLGEDLLVHASPRDNFLEYILPDDPVYDREKIASVFGMIDRHVYIGHTHRPGVITEEPAFYAPEEVEMEYAFPQDGKLIINVSSVGQPRDRDPRACYATVTGEGVRWHRVEYDVEAVVRKVEAVDCLDDRCGTRLREGK
jgi:diadenosine tetraphosphatase ApaH/serine/threonine PP2A family protein phosphatase